MEWFTVDKAGLAKLLERKGKQFVLFELLQNCWDTGAKRVEAQLVAVADRPVVDLTVTDDDPDGFKDLSHAFTLFAESEKKSDPTRRGRFNLGEKLVLALCEEARITSTKGSYFWDKDGRHTGRQRTQQGSIFNGLVRMTRAELAEVRKAASSLIPPAGVRTFIDGVELPSRDPIKSFEAALPTEASDDEGVLRRAMRKTPITVHEVLGDEEPMLYEMGIPVVPLQGGERWHVNIAQKVPISMERDNVSPAYLQTIRVLLANEMRESFTKEDANTPWVNAAIDDNRAEPETVGKVLDEKYGKKRAVYDPSDPEANKQLINEGYTVIPGGSMSKTTWGIVREAQLAMPAGAIRPSHIQYGDGPPEKEIPEEEWTLNQRRLVDYFHDLAQKLIQRDLHIRIVNEPTRRARKAAWYGDGVLTFNLGCLGKAWFESPPTNAHHELFCHELAHDQVDDHLTRDFADEATRIACKLAGLMFTDRAWFRSARFTP